MVENIGKFFSRVRLCVWSCFWLPAFNQQLFACSCPTERVLDRGEKIELLVTRTEMLQDQSYKFSSESRKLKWAMCRRNYVILAIIILVIIVTAHHTFPLLCPTQKKCPSMLITSFFFPLSKDHCLADLFLRMWLWLLEVFLKTP